MPPLSFPKTKPSRVLYDAEYTPARPALVAKSTALLIVDVQDNNWTESSNLKRDFPSFPENLQRTISHCRKTNTKVIWLVPENKKNMQSFQLSLLEGKSRKRRKVCQQEAKQPAMFPTPRMGDFVVAKEGISGTTSTRLLKVLKEHDIDTVLVCGLWTSVSVQHTAFGVFERGLRTLLVHDACADWTKARHEAAISLYGNYMYELVESSDLEPTQTSSIWHSSPSLPSVVSETEMANKAEDSVEENTSEESSIATTTKVSSTSFTSSNSIYNPIAFSTELQTIATIQQRVALFTR